MAGPEHEDLSKIRVLVVEDEAFAARLIVSALRLMRISEVTRAPNAAEAMRLLQSEEMPPFDLIISDWNMPGITGLALLKAVRARLPDVKFIMLTGNVSEESVRSAVKAGVSGYIAKPFSAEQLHAKVRSVLGKR